MLVDNPFKLLKKKKGKGTTTVTGPGYPIIYLRARHHSDLRNSFLHQAQQVQVRQTRTQRTTVRLNKNKKPSRIQILFGVTTLAGQEENSRTSSSLEEISGTQMIDYIAFHCLFKQTACPLVYFQTQFKTTRSNHSNY